MNEFKPCFKESTEERPCHLCPELDANDCQSKELVEGVCGCQVSPWFCLFPSLSNATVQMSWYQWLCLEAILYTRPWILKCWLVRSVSQGFPYMLACKMDRNHTHPSVPQECAKAVGEECGGPWEVNQSLDFHFPTICRENLDLHKPLHSTRGLTIRFDYSFLDALASLRSKLRLSDWVIKLRLLR